MASDLSLSCDEFKAFAKEGKFNLFPVYRTIKTDLETPITAFMKIAKSKHSFLFEQVKNAEQVCRYTYIGTEPDKVVITNDEDPLRAVEAEMGQYKFMEVEGLPSFTGGAIGYISYDCIRHFEKAVQLPEKNVLGLPESIFMFCKHLVIFDHAFRCMKIVGQIHVEEGTDLDKAYADCVAKIDDFMDRLDGPVPDLKPLHKVESKHEPGATVELTSNQGPEGYKTFVDSLKTNIVAGDIIQAVPSHRMTRKMGNLHPFDIYRQLRITNPSPYMFYVDHGDFQIVGASPEQLVRVTDGKVTTHPIAGTRKRGKTQEADDALAKELLENVKERAEHIMLVDLGRNDVGKVSVPGSVNVDSLMHIERYSHVMHIVSHVSGQLDPKKTVYDAFRSVFPAGTVSGAPKIRAMQLVGALEKERRGVYAGSLGWVSYKGDLDTCIAIRTIVTQGDKVHLQAGGGITYDSEREFELEETIRKMAATDVAVKHAEIWRAKREAASLKRKRADDGANGANKKQA